MIWPQGLKADKRAPVLVHGQSEGVLLQLMLVLTAPCAEVHARFKANIVQEPKGALRAEHFAGVELLKVSAHNGLLLYHRPSALLLQLLDDGGQSG